MPAAVPRAFTLTHASLAVCSTWIDAIMCWNARTAYARMSLGTRIGNLRSVRILWRMEASRESKPVPTVSRVAQNVIVELVYDARKRCTGLFVCQEGRIFSTQRL